MTDSVNSIDTIKNKIIAEAREYEKEILAQAEKEAAENLKEYEKKAAVSAERIISAAKAEADSIISSAESLKNMSARSGVLAVKVELVEKAYSLAVNELEKLDKDRYLELFSKYLVKAAESEFPGNDEIDLYTGKNSPVTAEELIKYAGKFKNSERVKACGKSEKSGAGFYLESGDITVDCSAGTLVSSIKNRTETSVARLLFGENRG